MLTSSVICDVISFCVTKKSQKIQKWMKIVNTEEENLHTSERLEEF